jgi:hypothetical protein
MDDELSYEEEQIQRMMMNEIQEKRKNERNEEIKRQDREYQESLKEDLKPVFVFEEVSVEEMRRIRLLRFN